jgi:predicted nucleic acid-binding protein
VNTLDQLDKFLASCERVGLPRDVCRLAAQIRAEHRLKTPDALHVAAAIDARCDEFWTNDTRIAGVPGIRTRVVG